MSTAMSRRGFIQASGMVGAVGAMVAVSAAPAMAAEDEGAEGQIDLWKVNPDWLMTEDEGREWHEYKNTCDPLYPGYTTTTSI